MTNSCNKMIFSNTYVYIYIQIQIEQILKQIREGKNPGQLPLKGTMSYLQAKQMKRLKFQRHLKDNTNLELP